MMQIIIINNIRMKSNNSSSYLNLEIIGNLINIVLILLILLDILLLVLKKILICYSKKVLNPYSKGNSLILKIVGIYKILLLLLLLILVVLLLPNSNLIIHMKILSYIKMSPIFSPN